jgi:GDP/UDP-N,N'-diacetylbacillosamine 2-epimerase (hydrolysing)
MPNADTFGTEFRRVKELLKREFPDKIVLVENFGKTNYFTAMKYCKFLLGNTSSGIIEAASFGKYVVNVGNRQKGRAGSDNILQTSFTVEDIVSKAFQANSMGKYTGVNIYYKPNAVKNIVSILKAISNEKL